MTDDVSGDFADDPELTAAGARLRAEARTLDPNAVEVAALYTKVRRRSTLAGAMAALVIVVGATFALTGRPNGSGARDEVADRAKRANSPQVDALVASLGTRPVDPTKVQLVATVQSFKSCDALIGDLRRIGAQHVGSRGFGGFSSFMPVAAREKAASSTADLAEAGAPAAAGNAVASDEGATLGTNVQVEGVDELDHVKAQGSLIYDMDGKGNLRITDAATLDVVSTLDVTEPINRPATKGPDDERSAVSASSMLVSKGRIAVFGTESDLSDPVPGDPSATQSSTTYFTVTFVDATDPAEPKVTDRVKVEGSLVAARLVGGEIRLVTSSDMADIGFVMPTTPASIPIALERNRRTVAASSAADWIPDFQRPGGAPEALVPCDRVHVPDTFAGVQMTSMVTFPIATGRFAPAGTSILAPSTTLYAGLDKVAISSQVWVDPVDQQRLKFPDWKTAIHEFTFPTSGAPDYVGSGLVEGSVVGQFAFGEVGDAIAVVSAKGTPWDQQPDDKVMMTLFTAGGNGALATAARVDDLGHGEGAVNAVRYLPGRVLVATGSLGQDVQVIDVTKVTAPRRAGEITLGGTTDYFHPLPDHRALVVGTRMDRVPGPNGPTPREWARAELLDVSNPDSPRSLGTWEEPWSGEQVGQDHHAFTFWPERNLAMWGVSDTRPFDSIDDAQPNHAVVLDVTKGLERVGWPEASKPPETPAPCPVVQVPAEAQDMVGPGSIVLGCADSSKTEIEWPRYSCYQISDDMIGRYAPDQRGKGAYFVCSLAPQPQVARVLVVKGVPILMTDQTLQALDPTTFAPVKVVYHPSQPMYGGFPEPVY